MMSAYDGSLGALILVSILILVLHSGTSFWYFIFRPREDIGSYHPE